MSREEFPGRGNGIASANAPRQVSLSANSKMVNVVPAE